MKRELWLCALSMLCATGLAGQQPTPEEIQAAMAQMGPGPEHAVLTSLEGDWELVTAYTMGPGMQTSVPGRAKSRLILGGRFLVVESAAAEKLMGMELAGWWIFGFDRRAGEYTVVGFDTFGTYHVSAAGKPGADGRIVMSGVNRHPKTGRDERFEVVLRVESADAFVSEIWFVMPDGTKTKGVESRHTRSGA